MIKVVRPSAAWKIARWIISSVALSIALVEIVQHQNAGIGQESARQGNSLPLPARQRDAAFANYGLVAFREAGNELMGLGGFCRSLDIFLGCTRFPKRDILGDRAGEKEDILLDDGNIPAQRFQVPAADIDTVNQHPTLVHLISPVDQASQGRFPKTRLSDDRYRLPRVYLKGQLLQDRLAAFVGKTDILEFDLAAHRPGKSLPVLVEVVFALHQLEDAPSACQPKRDPRIGEY